MAVFLSFFSFESNAVNSNPTWNVDAGCFFKSGVAGAFDEIAVKDPSIVYSGGKYHIFYTGVTGSFATIAKTNADRYLEVGFTSSAGTLGTGAGAEAKGRVWKSDWSNFTQTNDYSFNSTATNYADSTTITGYLAGALKWGTEP